MGKRFWLSVRLEFKAVVVWSMTAHFSFYYYDLAPKNSPEIKLHEPSGR